MVDLLRLRKAFGALSPREPRLFSAPGRVNLIGEHTDYNEGFVLPMAASLRTFVAAALRDDGQVRVNALDLNDTATFSVVSPFSNDQHEKNWLTYVRGITETLVKEGLKFGGADLAIASDVPIGAGLSSSAALEVSVGFALLKLTGFDISLLDLSIAAQEAEHVFVGTKSGLMDQLTATFAERDHAMFIDCRSLHIEQIPMKLPATAVAICDTGVKHALVSTAYNERREECERAVALLRQKHTEVRALRDLNVSDLNMIDELPEPERRRARHVVTENDRTLKAVKALEVADVATLGQLITQSHQSLRDDFEVSCTELNTMFDLAQSQGCVAGARMMGGGFGGCTVNLVEREQLNTFIEHMTEGYRQATGLVPRIFVVEADDGVREFTA